MDDAQRYMMKNGIPQLFEGLMTGLMYEKPDDHIEFLEQCLAKAKKEKTIKWNSFIEPLPPITGRRNPSQDELRCNERVEGAQAQVKQTNPLPPIKKHPDYGSLETMSSVPETRQNAQPQQVHAHDITTPSTLKITHMTMDDASYSELNNVKMACDIGHRDGLDDVAHPECDASPLVKEKPLFFVLGGPGVGKGTQCAILAKETHLSHISAGDLLRKELKDGGSESPVIEKCIKEGTLVPMSIIINLLKKAIATPNDDVRGFLIDGFPRETDQGIEFEAKVQHCDAFLMFECPRDVLKQRLLARAATSGRADDNEETIEKRLHTFNSKTLPVLQHFHARVKTIDANRTVEQIARDVRCIVDEFIDEDIDPQCTVIGEVDCKQPSSFDNDVNNNVDFLEKLVDDIQAEEEALVASGDSELQVVQRSEKITHDRPHSSEYDEALNDKVIEEEVFVAEKEFYTGDDGVPLQEAIQKTILVVIGSTGSGKTLLCQQLSELHGIQHLDGKNFERMRNPEQGEDKIGILEAVWSAVQELPQDSTVTIEGLFESVEDIEEFQRRGIAISAIVAVESVVDNRRKWMNDDVNATHLGYEELAAESVDEEELKLHVLVDELKARLPIPVIEVFNKASPDSLAKEVCDCLAAANENFSRLKVPSAMAQQQIIFVLGGPGSGKGTQCAKIVEKYGYCHLSTGDLLRDEVKSGTPRAQQLKDIMESGGLVSQDTILELLKDAITKNKEAKGFLIDGFPRDIPQGEKFEREIGNCKFILHFDCSNEEMTKRLLERAKSSGRVDDNEATIKKRLKTFENQTLPVLDKYGQENKTRKINAERSVDDIFVDVCKALEP